jgi:transcriptional regulator with XRE-family HTH domain
MSNTSAIDPIIGASLRMRRVALGLSAAKLAGLTGVPEYRIDEYESGDRRMDAEAMRRICRVMDVGVYHFFAPWVGEGGGAPTPTAEDYQAVSKAKAEGAVGAARTGATPAVDFPAPVEL